MPPWGKDAPGAGDPLPKRSGTVQLGARSLKEEERVSLKCERQEEEQRERETVGRQCRMTRSLGVPG